MKVRTDHPLATQNPEKSAFGAGFPGFPSVAGGRTGAGPCLVQTAMFAGGIRLEDLNELHRLESEIESIRPGLPSRLQNPATPERIKALGELTAKIEAAALAAVLSRLAAESGCDSLESALP